ncbi:hypothetical protein PUNSTDRAFT_141747 [Punctularia strigosozonata HHB-11173 SS5]|uniref:uncharacterized protein n=1 Tax=Punctularia strigosozonata (strain HHB-11173) TaxID=741275 RepID=UPI000441834E|nr:uncharacterized protein PUNSTDRAFT_141747 [Punctularia strigosozonata HHB-11173 SS5]EIN11358.1 hypothetical protein PUNSTDRAFT_141747 [Punctularia strigosozonata HHB-11173 SS5]
MTTSWEYPMRHPWVMPSLKRKLSTPTDYSDTDASSPASFHAKRRRCDPLEHGLAHLTLNHVPSSPWPSRGIVTEPSAGCEAAPTSASGSSQQPPHITPITPLYSEMDMQTSDTTPVVVLPTSVEEPVSPEQTAPEVSMSNGSWYEPEKDRVVITDLSSLDEDEDERWDRKRPSDYEISEALLRRLKSGSGPPLPVARQDDSQALVLFRPIGRSGLYDADDLPELESTAHIEELPDDAVVVDSPLNIYQDVPDDDAMDIEEL